MNHGVKKGSLPVQKPALSIHYKSLIDAYQSNPSLETSASILHLNPDYYTLWNDRKRALLASFQPDYTAELNLTSQVLAKQPKSYW